MCRLQACVIACQDCTHYWQMHHTNTARTHTPFVCFLGIDACLARQGDLDGLEDWEVCELVDFRDDFLRKKGVGIISVPMCVFAATK